MENSTCHLYAYCKNHLVNYTAPSGHVAIPAGAIIASKSPLISTIVIAAGEDVYLLGDYIILRLKAILYIEAKRRQREYQKSGGKNMKEKPNYIKRRKFLNEIYNFDFDMYCDNKRIIFSNTRRMD